MSTEAVQGFVRVYFPSMELWATSYRFTGESLALSTSYRKQDAKIFASPNLAELDDIGRRFAKLQLIDATFEEWVEAEAGKEAKT